MNTPGASIISTIKSGGNSFSGIENLAYEPGQFVGNNIDAATSARGFTGQPNLLFYEGHADLGGPILQRQAVVLRRVQPFQDQQGRSPAYPQTLATDLGIFDNFTTKESYKLSRQGHADRLLPVGQEAEAAARHRRDDAGRIGAGADVAELGVQRPMAAHVVEPVVLRSQRRRVRLHVPRAAERAVRDQSAASRQRDRVRQRRRLVQRRAAPTGPFVLSRGKPQAFGNLTYFLPTSHGTHDLKLGFEFMNDRSTNTANGTSGPILYFDSNGVPSQVRITDYGDPATFGSAWTQASDYDRHYSVYGQDRFSLSDSVTLTYGAALRPSASVLQRRRSVCRSLTAIFQPTTVPGATLLTADNVAPRLGVSWDLMGDSKSVVKAFYGRFYFNFADNLAGADPGGPNYKDITFNDLNDNGCLRRHPGARRRHGAWTSRTPSAAPRRRSIRT